MAGLDHAPGDRLRDDVAGRQVGQLVDALHEPVALPVDEEGTLAAHGLGDQRLLTARVGAEPHHRRVELDELQVAEHCAGAVGKRHPVARRDRGVRGLREDLPETAAGEDDGSTPDRAHPVVLALAHDVQRHAGHAAVVGQQEVDGEGVLDDLDLGGPGHGRDEGTLDLGPGGVAAGMGDAVAVVSALAGQAELAVGVEVEVGAEGDQLADGLGPLGDEHAHRLEVGRARAGHEGVALVLGRRVARTRARRRCRPAPTGSSPRRARPWSPRGRGRHCLAAAARPSARRCRTRSPRRRP